MVSSNEVGTVCVIRDSDNTFLRVQILNIVARDVNDKPTYVRLRLIDSGKIIEKLHVNELLEIPDELLQYKCPIIDVFITGCSPMDDERRWNEPANKDASRWFEKHFTTTSFISAKVLLHIGHAVWTDTLVIRSKLIGHPDLVSHSLKDVLIHKQHGTKNKDHLKNLLTLSINGGINDVNGHPLDLILSELEENVEEEIKSESVKRG